MLRLAVVFLSLTACEGSLIGGHQPLASPGLPTTPPPQPVPDDPSWPVRYQGTASALRRLTRDELVATFRTLTGDAPSRSDLPAESHPLHQPPITAGKPLGASELATSSFVVGEFVKRITQAMLARSACRETGAAQRTCLLSWATTFGTRALRRPLRAEELTGLTTLVVSADGTAENDGFAVSSVLNALFFSPSFLYRSDIDLPAGQGQVRALSGRELAVRLSYVSTLGPPDELLLNDAARGALSDPAVRASHFERLRQTPAGEQALAAMVLEWLGANEPKVFTKSAQYLVGLPTGFEQQLRASADSAIIDVLRSSNPTIQHLFSTESYLNDAPVQRITEPAGATQDTAETRRGGLLMHPHVLAASTKENGVSPFPLGAMLKESLLCEKLPAPPAGVAMQARADVPPGLTLREGFEHRTNISSACSACHLQFAPLGYSFLPFDPVGRWLRKDPSGKPWDLSGAPPTYSGILTFMSPRDLSSRLGASPQVHGCFAQFAASWTFGRGLLQTDEALVAELDTAVKRSGGNVLDLLRTLVRSSAFATTTTGS
jgi:hypothetical protein